MTKLITIISGIIIITIIATTGLTAGKMTINNHNTTQIEALNNIK